MLRRGRSDRLQDFRFIFLFLLAMLQFKTSFISMSGFALITTACFSPGLHLGSEENMSQPFELLARQPVQGGCPSLEGVSPRPAPTAAGFGPRLSR